MKKITFIAFGLFLVLPSVALAQSAGEFVGWLQRPEALAIASGIAGSMVVNWIRKVGVASILGGERHVMTFLGVVIPSLLVLLLDFLVRFAGTIDALVPAVIVSIATAYLTHLLKSHGQ
jgi:hypothetical protein